MVEPVMGFTDLAHAWRTLPLGAGDTHAEALTLAATRALRAGHAADAFEFIDRRCRISAPPRAVDLAIRALAAHLCNRPAQAERDLALAESADPLDPMVAMTRLRLTRDPDAVRRVADTIAGANGDNPRLLGAILARLAETCATPWLVGLDLMNDNLSGFAAWASGRSVELELVGPDGAVALPLQADPSLVFAVPGIEACRVDARPAVTPDRYRLLVSNGDILGEGRIWPRSSRPLAAKARTRAPERDVPVRAPLSVIVPVYRGVQATRECLEALAAEAAQHGDARIVVVNDASPEPELAELLDALAAEGIIELRRNVANLGFAGAVGRGLEGQEHRDILFLNADAVLPPGALERLAGAVYSAPDIGTATPVSNDGEYTSLPRHAEASPPPSPAVAQRIDAAAAAAGAGVVDIPTGTGFCLFVRHDCMAAVGRMPAVYGRGYFEDMEFCLLARRAGFRSVCATALFVVHHGSASFGEAKRALAVRNLGLLRRRFPGIEAECAAYATADPIRAAREAVLEAAGIAFPAAADVAAGDHVADEAPAERPPSIGVVSPSPSPECDAFVRGLSAALHAGLPQARIVVLGVSCDDLSLMGRGNVFVTGPLRPGEAPSVAKRYGVQALACPTGALHEAAMDTGLSVLHPAPSAIAETGARIPDPSPHANDPVPAIVAEFARRIAAPSAH